MRPRLDPDHRTERLARREKPAFQVHRDDVVEIALGHHHEELVAGEAGGVDEDLDGHRARPPEAGEKSFDFGGIGHVAAVGRKFEPRRPRLRLRLLGAGPGRGHRSQSAGRRPPPDGARMARPIPLVPP